MKSTLITLTLIVVSAAAFEVPPIYSGTGGVPIPTGGIPLPTGGTPVPTGGVIPIPPYGFNSSGCWNSSGPYPTGWSNPQPVPSGWSNPQPEPEPTTLVILRA